MRRRAFPFPPMRIFMAAGCLAALLVSVGCGGGGGGAGVSISAGGGDTGVSVSGGGAGGAGGAAMVPQPPASAPAPAGPLAVSVTELSTGLSHPWGLAFLPDGRMLVTERAGRLKLLSAGGRVLGDFSGVPPVYAEGQGGLLDVVLDPGFASNHRIYFSFAERDSVTPALNGTAVARAVLDPDALALREVTVIYRQRPKVASPAHFGSRLVFDRAGQLFVTLGERLLDQERGFAQDPARGHGKVVRITTDGLPAPGNPAWPQPGAQPEIWSMGHRNPQGAALHPDTGELWTSEHGPQGGDEVNRTLPGRNYGWPRVSRGQEYGTTRPVGVPTLPGMEDPAWVWETVHGGPWQDGPKSSTAPAGMAFYTGNTVPQWRGSLFVAALAGLSVWRLTFEGNRITAQERLLATRAERMRDVEQGPDGALYLLVDDASRGKLLRWGP